MSLGQCPNTAYSRYRSVAIGMLSMFALLGITACSDITEDTVKQQHSSTSGIIYCSESNPGFFNPQIDTSSTTSDASAHQIYSRLLDFDEQTGRIIPGLATSWLVSKDGLTYTFQLRRNVAFHTTEYFQPSRNFNADDVIFSFQRWLDEDHPYHTVNGGLYPYFDSLNLAQTIKSVKRINGYRVEITLYQPDSSFLANLATDFAAILSAQYAAYLSGLNKPGDIDYLPIGTGPYRFKEFRKDQFIRYSQHPQYWQQTERPEHLIFDITPSSSLRFAKLITGECDTIAYPSQTELEVMQANPRITVQEEPGLNIGFWAFNTSKAPFNDPKVRRALALAIDKSTILDAIYFNSATRARSIVPPASWAFSPNITDLNYNPVEARRLLKEAGYANGFNMNLFAMPVVRDYNPDAPRMAELIRSYLADINIAVDIQTSDWDKFRADLSAGKHDSVLIGWSADNGDPDNFYRPLLTCSAIPSGTNRAMWCHPEFDAIVNAAIATNDIDERKAYYQTANEIIAREIPLTPIAHAFRYRVHNNNIKGLTINPYGGIRFANVQKTPKVQQVQKPQQESR